MCQLMQPNWAEVCKPKKKFLTALVGGFHARPLVPWCTTHDNRGGTKAQSLVATIQLKEQAGLIFFVEPDTTLTNMSRSPCISSSIPIHTIRFPTEAIQRRVARPWARQILPRHKHLRRHRHNRHNRHTAPARTGALPTQAEYITVADTVMTILCEPKRYVTNPNTLIGSFYAEDLPDISPDDQRPIDNESQKKLHTNSYSWRAVFFSRPISYERTSALQVNPTYGRVRYAVEAAHTGERISVSLDLQLEECLRPAYRSVRVDEAWRLVSLLGESDDDRGPEANVRGALIEGDEVLASIQVSSDRNMMLVGRANGATHTKDVLMFVSELIIDDHDDTNDTNDTNDRGEGRWSLVSVDRLS